MHRIKLDGCEITIDLYDDEIYFPDHVEGYNQPSSQRKFSIMKI